MEIIISYPILWVKNKKMNEKEFIKNFFQSSNLTPVRQEEIFARIAQFGAKSKEHTPKRDFLGLAMQKFNNILPKFDGFWKIIEKRKTDRNFKGVFLKFSVLEKIIVSSFGKNRKEMGNFYHRTPSAGGLFGLQGYFINQNVQGLKKGIYYIDEEKEVLFLINEEVPLNLGKIFFYNDEDLFKKSSGIFIISTDMSLTADKYGVRSVRFALLDAGHCMQNICLASEKLNVKIIPIGGFDEEKVKKILKINNELEFPIYSAILGK